MSTVSTRFSTVSHISPPIRENEFSHVISDQISSLYALSQRSNYVFGSPVGPFFHRSNHLNLPRFVYFGPQTHDESLRLAFITGFNHQDLQGSFALLQFIEQLVLTPDLGHGLNLSLFPLIDVVGLFHGVQYRHLENENWAQSRVPEISLLSKDARTRGYHGFVRLESGLDEDEISVSLRGPADASGVELISSEDFAPYPVRWEADSLNPTSTDGPLSLVDDLPFHPFELTLRVPANWPSELHSAVISSVLKRFIHRYRAHQAYSQGI